MQLHNNLQLRRAPEGCTVITTGSLSIARRLSLDCTGRASSREPGPLSVGHGQMVAGWHFLVPLVRNLARLSLSLVNIVAAFDEKSCLCI